MSDKATGGQAGTAAAQVERKPRKKKAAARWAILVEIDADLIKSAQDRAGEVTGEIRPVFRIAADSCKSEKAAREAGKAAAVSGRVLLVCIHADGTATPKTQSEIVWK